MTLKATLRIIDANYNRAREALRVIEEYCRFALNHVSLCKRTKQIRHDLSRGLAKLDDRGLIGSRDTEGDVGTVALLADPMQRRGLDDCLRAACQRLTEALRALSEMIQIGDPLLARTIETLRYQSYTLEKDIMCLGQPAQRFSGVRLYVLLSGDEREKTLTLADQCARGGADCLQLRAKTLSDQTLFALAQEFVQLCRSQEVLSIINDRADIAIAAGADGVHLGLEDLPIEEVRKLALQPLIVGLTTHNRAELSAAVEKDPSYVAVGPAFPSPTKPTLRPAGLDYVKEALELLTLGGLNHAVIGGITADNLGQICSLGATTLAIGTHISASSSPAEACRRVKEALLATIS